MTIETLLGAKKGKVDFDTAPVDALFQRMEKLEKKLQETKELFERVNKDIEKIKEDSDPANISISDSLSVKMMQRELCPGIILSIEKEIQEIKEAIAEHFPALNKCIWDLLSKQMESITNKAVEALKPFYEVDGKRIDENSPISFEMDTIREFPILQLLRIRGSVGMGGENNDPVLRVKYGLAMLAEYKENGFFYPEICWGRATGKGIR